MTHIRFGNDEYEASDSEDDYTEKEKELLKKVRNRGPKDSDSDEEVYGLDSDEGSSDIALSDVEGQADEDDLPDVRAWGKDKRKFYSTDYVDPDYGGFQGKDAVLAEIEEEEAKNLQKQLAQQLDDEDFSLDLFTKAKESEDKVETEEIIKTDVSLLSKRQKLQLLQKESPEFFGLIEDFKAKMTLLQDYFYPIITLSKENKIKLCDALACVQTHYSLILNYCTNIYMYLLLKAKRINVQNHPVIKRLYQYRQLLSQLEPVFEEIIKPQVELIIKEQESQTAETHQETTKKTLNLLAKLNKNVQEHESKSQKRDLDSAPLKKKQKVEVKAELESNGVLQANVKVNKVVGNKDEVNSASEDGSEDEVQEEQQFNQNTELDGKRAITYQMAKNKGLTPHRKKEQRNPRVKHRNKFRKAKIRRKGAVREVRREVSRYGGEISGIKTSVTKSIKIKS